MFVCILKSLACSAKKSLGRLPLSHSSKALFLESVGAFRLAGGARLLSSAPASLPSTRPPAAVSPGGAGGIPSVAADSCFPLFLAAGFRPVMSLTDTDSPYLLSTFSC